MAGVGGSVKTLLDLAKQQDPDGSIATIAELLQLRNVVLQDAHWEEGNLTTGHRHSVRTGLPTAYWRSLNAGGAVSKATEAQVTDTTGSLEAWSEVDEELAELSGDISKFRFNEAQAFVQSMNTEATATAFYGNSSTAPEEFTGLDVRFNSLSAGNARNVVAGAGAGGDNTSIWFIVWGPQTCFFIYPRGSQVGLKHEDFGVETVEVTAGVAGTRMRAYRDKYSWKLGLVVKDWRFVSRVCNLDVSGIASETIITDMTKAYHKIEDFNMGRAAIYMNRTVFQQLDIEAQAAVKAGGGLTYENVNGQVVPMFRGIPIRVTDAIGNAEALVS